MPADPRRFLRVHRALHDLTQSEAAAAVDVSRHTWARWEGGEILPSLEQAVALSVWAGVALEDVADAFGLGTVGAIRSVSP